MARPRHIIPPTVRENTGRVHISVRLVSCPTLGPLLCAEVLLVENIHIIDAHPLLLRGVLELCEGGKSLSAARRNESITRS
jgi:hypothetical protein